MRNKSAYFARISSKTVGTMASQLSIRKRDIDDSKDVYFTIIRDAKIFDCYRGCTMAVKIDDNPIFNLQLNGGEGGDSVFIKDKNLKDFVAKMKQGKQMIVELPVYREGKKQFKFNIEGLKWDHF